MRRACGVLSGQPFSDLSSVLESSDVLTPEAAGLRAVEDPQLTVAGRPVLASMPAGNAAARTIADRAGAEVGSSPVTTRRSWPPLGCCSTMLHCARQRVPRDEHSPKRPSPATTSHSVGLRTVVPPRHHGCRLGEPTASSSKKCSNICCIKVIRTVCLFAPTSPIRS